MQAKKLSSAFLKPVPVLAAVFSLLCAVVFSSCQKKSEPTMPEPPASTATNTPYWSPTDMPTMTATHTGTGTCTPLDTNTMTITPTFTETPADTGTFTPTDTPTFTVTPADTLTHTLTHTLTPSQTHTQAETATVTVTSTATHTVTGTATPTSTVAIQTMEFRYGFSPAPAYQDMQDTFIEDISNLNYGVCPVMHAGFDSSIMRFNRSIVRFGLDLYLPASSTVVSAVLLLNVSGYSPAVAPVTIGIYECLDPWQEGPDCPMLGIGPSPAVPAACWLFYDWVVGAPWQGGPGGAMPPGQMGAGFGTGPTIGAPLCPATLVLVTPPQVVPFPLDKNIVQGWVANPPQNSGMFIVEDPEAAAGGAVVFDTKEGAVPPVLVIQYY